VIISSFSTYFLLGDVNLKKIILILIFISAILIPKIVYAEEIDLAPSATSAIIIEASTGEIIWQKNAHEKLAPASMTKMMSMLLIMEAVESGKISLNDMIPISSNASSMGGSQVFLQPNTEIKAEDLIRSIAVASANDSAVAMAEAISGTVDAFVNKMNERAKALGCTNTNFANVHGLDDPNHYTTAHDMALMAKELLKHEKILEYSSTYESYLQKPDGTSTWMVNTNKLIKYYNGLDGLKTGFTSNAGYCLTATAKRNGMRLISVLMKEPTSQIRNSETIELLNYGFTNYKIKTILSTKNDLGYVEVLNGKQKAVNIKLIEDATNLESINEEKNYTYNIKVEPIKAPVKVGQNVGYLEIISDGKVLKTVNITVTEDVKKANLWDLYKRNLNTFLIGN